ncbi:hypothetical protein Cs7R123_67930 [Catellatospora sp. TT07R-123]|uniref:CBS domain-containing protein n=1 Tax=Catellatospora sp. TT07R-123 TaxID=2733863 RepID=UPI001B2DC6CE|nr:CBS domain-containing protein [Catellatospora sp. TT07R-123]GHJ49451.1 hypothetical protein Cs7R123_67930 [Catellatospora sp. TT07R-123]
MATRTVADVMTAPVISVAPQTSYREIIDLLAEHGISAMPVVDADGTVLGVVSEADLLHKLALTGEEPQRRLFERRRRAVVRAKAAGDTAADLMTTPAVVVRPGATVVEAARIMENEQVKRMPVVAGGRLVGVVSRRDLLRTYRRTDEAIRHDVVHDVIEGMLFVRPPQVDAQVADGIVTLTGSTGRRSTAQIAEHLVRTVPGVVDVVNELTSERDDTGRERRHDFDAEVDGPERPRDGTLDIV